MARQSTFVIIKPDAFAAGHVGHILSRYEEAGLVPMRLEVWHVPAELADRHYAEHLDRDYYAGLREFITSGPLVACELVGEGAIELVRTLNGAKNPAEAEPGTIRADYGTSIRRNAVHASDSPESAARELALWFGNEEN
ncbi:nucleoside-diphosphate kinase [Arachnia propionica]|uniref:Nucleoside diphosphate kinase n=1 Tax=Arachnia propionica TaxID=1750 RepID=A0A3P1T844_9ACTN|nr:nucleoside-diphosphate kinase [Arachnia propionica]MDO5083821.1 nucleoside-diphosphate kinase [Arachnia propionica]RRD04996.1 nucleoside-diphosphate kinase [Arachnia propionica]